MNHVTTLAVVLLLAATPVAAQKVDIDYAHDFDFKSVKTFQYVDTKETDAADSLMASRIKAMIKEKLSAAGLVEVQSNPDIFVTNHVTTAQMTTYDTTHYGYGGYYGGWYGWGGPVGISTSTTTQRNYTEGTLIIDAWEPKDDELVWRGTGTVTVKAQAEKRVQQVEKILDKLGKRWKKILAGRGK